MNERVLPDPTCVRHAAGTSDKSPNMNDMNDMNEKWENTSSASTGNPGGRNESEGRNAGPREPSLGGKDHATSPACTLDERIFVEDGSKAPATKVPGASKAFISEDLTQKNRPGMAACGVPEKHAGNSPTGVGISHQWMEMKL